MLRGTNGDRRTKGRCLKERRCFAVDYALIILLGGVSLYSLFHLEEFSLCEVAKGCGKDPGNAVCIIGCAKDGIHSLYQPVISYEDGGVGVKETCHCGTAPSFRSAVHYVVVKQGGVMEKFRRRRKLYGVVVRSPHCIGTEKCQGRPHHLAGIFPEGTVGGVKKGYV